MTPKQTQLYWREWSKAKKALESAMDPSGKTRLSAIEAEQRRHEIALEACGKQSTKDFTNKDLDKVLAAFRALSDPANLNAQLAQQEMPRRRMVYGIQDIILGPLTEALGSGAQKYADTVAKAKFGRTDLDQLTLDQLTQLRITLESRAKNLSKTISDLPSTMCDYRSELEPAFATATDPF